jgi:uncharacterized membrane protein
MSGASAGGGTAAAPAPAPGSVAAAPAAGLTDNMAGMLAYVTIIPAIIFLVMEPYNRKPFVRFHSFQSIFFGVAWIAISFLMSFLLAIPGLGLLSLFLWPLLGIAGLVIWVMLLMKANGGQMWKLPVIGDLAAKQAGV